LTDEVRVVDPVTGGEKGQKLAQLGAVDPLALLEVAKVAGFGADKYERYNFLRGYNWSLSFDAMQRHALAYWSGEDTDPESGVSHMAHVAWHALAMIAFAQRQVGTDDRPKAQPARDDDLCRRCGWPRRSPRHGSDRLDQHGFAA
jgi:hypothetical protein